MRQSQAAPFDAGDAKTPSDAKAPTRPSLFCCKTFSPEPRGRPPHIPRSARIQGSPRCATVVARPGECQEEEARLSPYSKAPLQFAQRGACRSERLHAAHPTRYHGESARQTAKLEHHQVRHLTRPAVVDRDQKHPPRKSRGVFIACAVPCLAPVFVWSDAIQTIE